MPKKRETEDEENHEEPDTEPVQEVSDITSTVVPEVGSMTKMPPEMAQMFMREFSKAFMDKKAQEPQQIIDIEALPLDIMGMVPQFDQWYWYKGWKRDVLDSNKIVYDIYVTNQKIAKILAKQRKNIDTRWGAERAKAYVMWTVIRARTYDPNNKRVVPIRQIVMTPLMARRGANVTKLLDALTPAIIKRSVEHITRHEELVWADVAKMKTQEAETAWAIVEKKADSHFKSTERMLKYAGESEDKGDTAFAKSFTENKDWKDRLAENWCLLLFIGLIVLYLVGYSQGWWGR